MEAINSQEAYEDHWLYWPHFTAAGAKGSQVKHCQDGLPGVTTKTCSLIIKKF